MKEQQAGELAARPAGRKAKTLVKMAVAMAVTMAGLIGPYGPAAWAADSYPSRTVSLVVPFSPGGATDILGRLVAQKLGERLKSNVIVVNTPGAAGTIGAASVAKAAPDGHTLLLYHIAMVTTHHVQKSMPYDPLRDFTPIAQIGAASNVVSINPSYPIHNLSELVDYAKQNPGALHFGSSGFGGSDHLGGELLQRVTGIELTHVPYKGGGPAIVGAVGGEIQMNAGTVAQAVNMIQAGKLRGLAVMQKERSPALPDIPSSAEAGYAELDHATWFGLWGPAGMPEDLLEKISATLREILAQDDVGQAMQNVGIEPRYSTPDEFAQLNRQQLQMWNEILDGRFNP